MKKILLAASILSAVAFAAVAQDASNTMAPSTTTTTTMPATNTMAPATNTTTTTTAPTPAPAAPENK